MNHLEIAKLLDARRQQIVEQAVEALIKDSFWVERYGPGIRERLGIDCDMNLAILAKGVRYRSPMLLDDHMRWRRNQIVSQFGCSTGHVREVFSCSWTAISDQMPAESLGVIYQYIDSAMAALVYPSASANALAAAAPQLAENLVQTSHDQHWHWQVAYQRVGQRETALREAWFLFDYAVDSLGMQRVEIIGKYTRLLRDRLAKRGLSTMHVQQLLWLAAESAEAHLPPLVAGDTRRMFEQATTYIFHDSEPCRALNAAQEEIIGEVARQLVADGLAPQPDHAVFEVGWYLAYLNDGLASGDPAGLVGYTRWMQQWLSSQGLPDTPLRRSYAALDGALGRYLPTYVASDAHAMLGAARRIL